MLTRYAQHDLMWIDLVAPTPTEVRALVQEFSLDPVLAQELLVPSFKPKVERCGDGVFLILHFPALKVGVSQGGGKRCPEQEIDFIIGKKFLITTRYEAVDPLHSFAKAFEAGTILGRGSTHGGHLFVAMTKRLYEALGTECDEVYRHLQDIEERIFNGDERRMVREISHTGRTIHDFRQALLPHHEMIESLEPVGGRLFGAEFSYYARELMGAYQRVERSLTKLYDVLHELRATNDSLLNTKQNEIMKTLTVLAFLFLPLTFITGLFGMNTTSDPIIGTPGDFWKIFGAMVALAVACLIYFKRKGWL